MFPFSDLWNLVFVCMKEFFLLETGRHIRYEEQANRREALMNSEKPEFVITKATGQCFSKSSSSSKNAQGDGSHNVAEMGGSSDWYQSSYSLNRFSNYQPPVSVNLQQSFVNEQPQRHSVAEDFNARKGSLSSSGSTSGRYSGEECGGIVQAYPTSSNSGPFESGYGNGWQQQQQQLPSRSFHSTSVHNCFDSNSSTNSSPGSYQESTPNEIPAAGQSFPQVQQQHVNEFQESTSIYTQVMYQYQSDVIVEPRINGGQQFGDGAFSDPNNNSNVAFSNGNVYTCLQ